MGNKEETQMDTSSLCTSNWLLNVFFFFPRTINEWNELPSEAVSVGEAKLCRAKLGTHMYIKRVRSLALNGLAFPVETASVAGSCTPFTPFIVHLLLYWPWPPAQSVYNLALLSNKQEKERKEITCQFLLTVPHIAENKLKGEVCLWSAVGA